MHRPSALLALVLTALFAAQASAHFLWINKVTTDAGKPTVELCFGEEAAPGEAEFVDRLATAKLWAQSANEKPALLKLEKKITGETGSFAGPLAAGQAGLVAAWDYGVISRGDKTFLLQYYAKHLDTARPDELKQFGSSDQLRLDVVPTIMEKRCQLAVRFAGKPAVASQVMVSVPGGKQQELKTDDQGQVSFELPKAGKYEIRARVQHDQPGEREGKAYTHEMHYTTLVLLVAPEK